MKHTIEATTPEGKKMKFICPTLSEAQELADTMKADGFTAVKVSGPAFAVYYASGLELFGVLDPHGFDALGEGFETIEQAQAEADRLNNSME